MREGSKDFPERTPEEVRSQMNPAERAKVADHRIVELEDELEKAKAIDSLTGLYTKGEFKRLVLAEVSTLNQAERKGMPRLPITIVYLDIDHMKTGINDVYGHETGSRAIREVAHTIRDKFRRGGDVLSRPHGDEFVVAASGSVENVYELLDRIQKKPDEKIKKEPKNFGEFTIRVEGIDPKNDRFEVSVSFGLAPFKMREGESAEEALDRTIEEADKWMYRAKGDKAR